MASCDPVFIRRSPLISIVSHPLTQIGLIWKAMKNGFWSGKYLPTRLGKSIVSLHNDRDDNDDVNNVFIIVTINFWFTLNNKIIVFLYKMIYLHLMLSKLIFLFQNVKPVIANIQWTLLFIVLYYH